MKKILPLLLLPIVCFGDFQTVDSQNLTKITTDTGTISQELHNFHQLWSQHISSWGGNFIKTVGNSAAKFMQEFGANGWFPAVKASIAVIQADVGRIVTALTTVNDHLEIIEGDVSSINDTVQSIDSSVSSISSDITSLNDNTSDIVSYLNSVDSLLFKNWSSPQRNPIVLYSVGPPNGSSNYDRIMFNRPNVVVQNRSVSQYDNFFEAVFNELQLMLEANVNINGAVANTIFKQHAIYLSSVAATNLLQKILDTNDVWYAKIYDRIPTNLTVVVSNIASNASNDWRYTVATALSSAPVFHNLTPSRDRDINQSYSLVPPELTGDFKADVILLLGNMQQIASSSASVDMDILTNLQVVAGSILSASAEVGMKADETRQNAENIASEGQSHEHDLDSAESYFDIHDSNTDVYNNLSTFANLPSKFTPLAVSHVADNYTIEVPSFSVYDSGSSEPFHIEMDISRFQGYFDSVRSCFAVFWFGFAFFIVWKFLLLGVRLLGWISSLINPFQFNAGVRGHDLSSFHG